MKRSFAMLLVVAILAMMVPGFALAEEATTPTMALSATSAELALKYTNNSSSNLGISVTVKGNTHTKQEYVGYDPETYESLYETVTVNDTAYIRVTETSDSEILEIDYDDNRAEIEGDGTVNLPSAVLPLKEGKANVTVELSRYSWGGTVYATAEIAVEVKRAAAIESVVFDKANIPAEAVELTAGTRKSYAEYIKVLPEDKATYYDQYNGVLWSVSDPKVAKVDKYGNVTGVAEGTVVLYAVPLEKTDAAKAELTLTVKAAKEEAQPEVKAPKLVFSTADFTVEKGSGENLNAYLKVLDPVDDDELIWVSSDKDIASVDSDGYVYGQKVGGPVTITVRSKKVPTATVTCTVTVVKAKKQLEEISFTAVPATVKLGDTLSIRQFINLKKSADDVNDYFDELIWTSSNPQVAYVEGTTLWTRNIGNATITATYEEDTSKTASFDIEVIPVPITKIDFAKSEYTLVVGNSYYLREDLDYTFEPSNYTAARFTVTLTSDNDDVVYVGEDYISALDVGEAKVTMTVRNADGSVVVSDPITVKVTDKALTGIAFKKDAYTVTLSNRQSTKTLKLKLTPADANVEAYDLYVESSDLDVAEAWISESGNTVEVTAIKPGTATITVRSHADESFVASTTVTVKPILMTSVAFAKSSITVPMYDALVNTTTIKAVIKPSDAYCAATWETSDASVAFVSDNDKNDYDNSDGRKATLYAVGPGTATITLTATDGTNTYKATMDVTVKAAKVTKLALSTTKATVYMFKGQDNTLKLTATDTKTDYAVPVTWKSSDKKIATVSRTGLVTFKGAGKVTITATTKDGNDTTATCKLTIKKLKVKKVVPAKKALTMKAGEEATLKVKVKPAKAFNPAVKFKSSKPKVVSVDAEGNLVALKAGKAVITITAKDGSKKSAKVTVTVKGINHNAIDEIVETETEAIEAFDVEEIEAIEGVAIDEEAIEIVDGAIEVVLE